MRLIDADALAWVLKHSKTYHKVIALDVVLDAVRCSPTIDAVSIVRCKECKHKYQEPWNNGVAVEGECEIWHSATLDNDYCSYGERGGRVNEKH